MLVSWRLVLVLSSGVLPVAKLCHRRAYLPKVNVVVIAFARVGLAKGGLVLDNGAMKRSAPSIPLPIESVLPELVRALDTKGRAVLVAPPGAGKTTRVPLALLEAGLGGGGRILMLEPRRLAARAAAAHLAESLGEAVGERVGFRIRGEAKVSKATRIEVVTEGILTRMLQSDPSLEGVGAVIFDEFHERSLNADLGLALCWEARGALREDLVVLVMSATLDAQPVAALLDDAPVVVSEGRAWPVETRWLERPPDKRDRLEHMVADKVLEALVQAEGDILVFLPGAGEIRQALAALSRVLPDDVEALPLYGALDFKAQRAALRPARDGFRRVVLATAIAETSLTIPGVRVVVDAGLARRARLDPGNGMTRLVTERVSRAEAEQRRGRAGRVAPGLCYRLWTRASEGAMAAFAPAEIEVADLSGLALELALWGAGDGEGLAFLTPPNPGILAEARALLRRLGALDEEGRITAHGKEMTRLPLHPRLAHMLLKAGRGAAALAALTQARDPLARGAGADMVLRLRALEQPDGEANRAVLGEVRAEARRLARMAGPDQGLTPAQMAALAWPDRVGLRRNGKEARYLLSGGYGAVLDEADALAGQRLLVVVETDGARRDARIYRAFAISEAELRAVHGDAIAWHDICLWDMRARKVVARRQERFGALVLDDRIWRDAPREVQARAMLDGVRELGLFPSDAARRFMARVELVRAGGQDLPEMCEPALMARLEEWLLPHLGGVRSGEAWKRFDLLPALRAMLDWQQMALLDRLAPAYYQSPLGRKVAVEYGAEGPQVSVRLQEMFGLRQHPCIAGRPLRIILLSPAGRPVQTTSDLPGFWANTYGDVRKDMRGRYPKHPWPDDPLEAVPTTRAKPRR